MQRSMALAAFGACALLSALWTLVAGKDLNWDLLNYHYYAPFEFVAGRLDQDFFAASAQSYLNPVGYLPFYAMVSAGWHSVAVSIVLAVLHSASIALLYVIAFRRFAHLPRAERIGMASLATALGAATAVFWAMVGTSFLDPLLAPLVLTGLLLLLDESAHGVRSASLAGALFGAAAALKYSNAVFAIAALPLVLALPGASARVRLRAVLGYGAAGAVAVALLAGPWFALLARTFGNPVFPLLSGWFGSVDAPAASALSVRFTPQGIGDVLLLPLRMAVLDRSLYAEIFAPDIRPAALLACLVALAIAALVRGSERARSLDGTDWRLLGFLALSFALWAASSGNGRYALPLLLLTGIVLARIAERLLPLAAARVLLALIVVLQLATSIEAAPARWFIAEPWSRHWLPFAVPQRALAEPALYLSLETLPMAVVAPFLHPASSLVNFRGQQSLPPDAPRLLKLLERHRGHVRVMGRSLELTDGKPAASEVRAYDGTLARIGYRVDPSDCFTIGWQPDDGDAVSRAANAITRAMPTSEKLSVVSCALVPAVRDPVIAARERRASAVFDRIEKACPRLFRGQTAVTEPLGGGWSRHYVGLDARLEALPEQVVLNRYRAGQLVELGRLADWEADAPFTPSACR
ncbi:MAG TPA: hypothetical protein VFJ70_10005 [Burkholderiales bacterium]|nr:hypothetical protein [Burkholderiales bacterium]